MKSSRKRCCRIDFRFLLTKKNVAWGATSFGASLLRSIFGLYRIDLFTSVYKLDASYFYVCQLVYAVWNAINDPLFGWIIDHSGSGAAKRLPAIKYGGPLWALSFLLPWWPWADPTTGQSILAFQFCFCLCAFDTFLTYVLLVYCALFADMTTSNQERNNMNLLRVYAEILGAGVGSIAYLFYDKKNLTTFRFFCVFIAALASASFWYSGTHIKLDRMERQADAQLIQKKSMQTLKLPRSVVTFFKELMSHKNFWRYVSMNFLQNFSIAFNGAYYLFFIDKVVTPLFPTFIRRLFIAANMYGGFAVVPLLTPYANRYGKHAVLWYCTIVKLVLALGMTVVGVTAWHLWAPLFVLNTLLLQSSGFYDVVIADVIDEDMVRYDRRESMSTSVHGIQALFVKPAQSFAPMLGVYVLSQYAINHSTAELVATDDLTSVQAHTYQLFVTVNIVTSVLQLVVWNHYSLHGAHLDAIKSKLNDMDVKASTSSPIVRFQETL